LLPIRHGRRAAPLRTDGGFSADNRCWRASVRHTNGTYFYVPRFAIWRLISARGRARGVEFSEDSLVLGAAFWRAVLAQKHIAALAIVVMVTIA